MNGTVIVSDLHLDNWTGRQIQGKNKLDHFLDFLAACERAEIRELVINGDLMNFPPFVGHMSFPATFSYARRAVEALIEFNSKATVTWVFGNHDIGVSGLRMLGIHSVKQLANVNFVYPAYSLSDYPNATVLIEHGHLYDPALAVYLAYFADKTFNNETLDDFYWKMQREGLSVGALAPLMPVKGQTLYDATQADVEPAVPPVDNSFWAKMGRLFKKVEPAVRAYRKGHWKDEAIKSMTEYLESRHKAKPELYQVFGHTHRADYRGAVRIKDVDCYYANSGTWEGQSDTATYLYVDESGAVWLYDWINDKDKQAL